MTTTRVKQSKAAVTETRETAMGHFRVFFDSGCMCSPPLCKQSTCQVTCFPLSVQNAAEEEVLYLLESSAEPTAPTSTAEKY